MTAPPGVVSLEPELKAGIINYCAQLESGINATHKHLLTYVQLEGSTGMLTRMMYPKYIEGREQTLSVFDAMEQVVAGLREQFAAACTDFETYEEQVQSQLDTMGARIAELEALLQAGAGGGGGGGGGYGGGGAFTPPPTPEIPQFDDDQDHDSNVNISISVDADGNVDVDAEGDNVIIDIDIDIDADQDEDAPNVDVPDDDADAAPTDSGDTSIGGATGAGSGGGGGGYAGTPEPAPELSRETLDGVVPESALHDLNLTPAEQAERAAFYEQLWEEQAARDPLGRSAAELRLAWENRDPLVIDSAANATGTVGYDGSEPGLVKIDIPWGVVPAAAGASA